MNLRTVFFGIVFTSALLVFSQVSSQSHLFNSGKLVPSTFDNGSPHTLGDAIIVSGKTTVVARSKNNIVFVYERPSNGWGSSTETVAIHPPEEIESGEFGYHFDIYNDVLLIGGNSGTDTEGEIGAVYIYEKLEGSWSDFPTAKITSPISADGERFGRSFSMHKDVVAVSSSGSIQAVHVFERPSGGWADLREGETIYPPSQSGEFARRLDLGDGVLIATSGTWGGGVYLYEVDSGSWGDAPSATLFSSDQEGADNFGAAIALNGDVVAISSPWWDSPLTHQNHNSGAVFVYTRPEDGWESMSETARLTPSKGGELLSFGLSISMSENQMFVGASYQEVYYYLRPEGGWVTSSEDGRLPSPRHGENDGFGRWLSFNESELFVSAPSDNDSGVDAGALYVFSIPSPDLDYKIYVSMIGK